MENKNTMLNYDSGYSKNRMYLEVDSLSENEAFVRIAVAAFCTRLDPTLEEVEDVKTAVSEAVTNAIIHGYQGGAGIIITECEIQEKTLRVTIRDKGCGIENVEQAKEPLFTTKPEEERSGMGFSFMEIFMDELEIFSEVGQGTTVVMQKTFGQSFDE